MSLWYISEARRGSAAWVTVGVRDSRASLRASVVIVGRDANAARGLVGGSWSLVGIPRLIKEDNQAKSEQCARMDFSRQRQFLRTMSAFETHIGEVL